MKKNKFGIICVLVLILICCFSTVVCAEDFSVSGLRLTKTYQDNSGRNMVQENTTLKLEGVSYDSDTETYYYEKNGERQKFSYKIKNGEDDIKTSLINNSDGSVYVKLPSGVTYDDLQNSTLVVDNDEISLKNGNIRYEQQETTDGDKSKWQVLWGLITDTVNTVVNLVEATINNILLPFGDGLLYVISRSVGEQVTIDGIIFNSVEKVDANFWATGSNGSVKNILSKVVTYWYNVFRKIAIVVYMITLVGIGISIMLNSTAQKKAKYKGALMSWVVGVAILFLFPYVMKYTIELNNAVVGKMQKEVQSDGISTSTDNDPDKQPTFGTISDTEALKTFGNDDFIFMMSGKYCIDKNGNMDPTKINDTMMRTRLLAQKTNKIILTVIYFILIGQTTVLLFAYYKRAFMLAFLITIFPLVAMSYAIDKLGDKKAQSFGIWFKEYIVNVIVQMFHAAVYVLVVNASVKSFLDTNGSNWLFMILSVLFLFEGEKILRSIFNVKSSAGTLGDLAVTGAAVMTVATKTAGLFGGNKNSNDLSANDQKHEKEIAQRSQAATATQNAKAEPQSTDIQAVGGSTAIAANSDDNKKANESKPLPSDVSSVSQSARDAVAKKVYERKKKGRKLPLSNVNRTLATGAGTLIGASYGLATGKGAGDVFNWAEKGKAVGRTVGQPVSAALSKVDNLYTGMMVQRDINNGEMDQELGIEDAGRLSAEELSRAEAEAEARAVNGEDISVDEVIAQYATKKQEIIRRALAAYANRTARKGEASGRLKLEEYIDEHRV